MKRSLLFLVAIAVTVALATPAIGADKDEMCKSQTVASLLMAIRSDNEGLRESAAFILGEMKCTRAVVPLMQILHDAEKESTRIIAALALSRIGEERGAYAVKQAVKYDVSRHVQVLCAYFYNEYVSPDSFGFIQADNPANIQVVAR
jgi:HEAT repeat protein